MNKIFFAQNTNLVKPGLGYLYNGYTVFQSNFAPSGWHVPTSAEWTTLTDYLGGLSIAGGKMKEVGYKHWITPNTGATNSSGFTATPGQHRETDGSYGVCYLGHYYSMPYEHRDVLNDLWYYSYVRTLYYNNNTVNVSSPGLYKSMGLSVRLIKDDSTDPGVMYDIEGNSYPTVKIGNQVWITENWKSIYLNNSILIPEITDNTTWQNTNLPDNYALARCVYMNNSNYL